jgi:urease accessory protein
MWCEKVIRNISEPGSEPPHAEVDYVDIGWDECRSLLKKRSRGGEEVRVLLDRTERLRHGDVLLETAERAIVINVQPCEVIVVRAGTPQQIAELAFDLGNLHWPVQVTETEVIFLEDEAAMKAVQELGLPFTREARRFEPLPVLVTLGASLSEGLRILRSDADQGDGVPRKAVSNS